MFDHKNREHTLQIKTFQRIQKACEWMYIIGTILVLAGFLVSINYFLGNTSPDLTIKLLISGLAVLCLASIISELSYLSEIWTHNRRVKYLIQKNLPSEETEQTFLNILLKEHDSCPNIIPRQTYLNKNIASSSSDQNPVKA